MTTTTTNTQFNMAELISWGYETSGDFDEALRVYGENNAAVKVEVGRWTKTELAAIERKFNREFAS